MSSGKMRTHQDVFHPFQRAVDIILIVAAHALACALHPAPWRREVGDATVIGIVIYSVAAEMLGVYRPWQSEHFVSEARPVLLSWIATAAALVFGLFATKTSTNFSRVTFFTWLIVAPVALCAWRMVGRAIRRGMWASGRGLRTVAIAGSITL